MTIGIVFLNDSIINITSIHANAITIFVIIMADILIISINAFLPLLAVMSPRFPRLPPALPLSWGAYSYFRKASMASGVCERAKGLGGNEEEGGRWRRGKECETQRLRAETRKVRWREEQNNLRTRGEGRRRKRKGKKQRIKEGKVTMLTIMYIPSTERVNFKVLIA